MIIAIGDKHFLESDYIVEILKPVDRRAYMIIHSAAGKGRLINATGGARIRSIIRLKSKHIVLSSLEAKTLKSKIGKKIPSSEPDSSNTFRPKHKTNYAHKANPDYNVDRRVEPDRRHYSYTRHIPERRSGTDRRIKKGKSQPEKSPNKPLL